MPEKRRESLRRRIAYGLLAVISIVALAWAVVTGIQRREFVECNAHQSALVIEYLEQTREAAAEERRATDAVRRAQLNGDDAAEEREIRRYFEVRKEADERRARAALPPLPETVCGEPGS